MEANSEKFSAWVKASYCHNESTSSERGSLWPMTYNPLLIRPRTSSIIGGLWVAVRRWAPVDLGPIVIVEMAIFAFHDILREFEGEERVINFDFF